MKTLSAYLGLAAVTLFLVAFVVLAVLTPEFNFLTDYISKLGAKGAPWATWWNLIGFALVGVTFAGFGWALGRALEDRIVGGCLMVSGMGFALAAIPTDLINDQSPMSKAHFVAVCFGLAGWCLGLARLGMMTDGDRLLARGSNVAAGLTLVPMLGIGVGVCTEPISHRLVLLIIFGWVVFISLRTLLRFDTVPANS